MERWYTINLGIDTPAEHYNVGDFNNALFTVTEMDYIMPHLA